MSLSAPSVVTYTNVSNKFIIVTYVTRFDNRFLINIYDFSRSLWDTLDFPANMDSSPVAVTYLDTSRAPEEVQRVLVFVTGGGGEHLYAAEFDGSSWKVTDHGPPPDEQRIENPSVITYPARSGIPFPKNHAFLWGSKGLQWRFNGILGWAWENLSLLPGGIRPISGPGSITFLEETSGQRIYNFVLGADGHLWCCYFDGTWHWADQGVPPGPGLIAQIPAVVTYRDNAGRQRIYIFVLGQNFHLYCNYWDGNSWQWADQGAPAGPGVISGAFALTHLNQNGNQLIYAFVTGDDGNVYLNYWNGFTWQWINQGHPRSSGIMAQDRGGSAIVVGDMVYSFVPGNDGHLYLNYQNAGAGGQWRWRDQDLDTEVG